MVHGGLLHVGVLHEGHLYGGQPFPLRGYTKRGRAEPLLPGDAQKGEADPPLRVYTKGAGRTPLLRFIFAMEIGTSIAVPNRSVSSHR